MALADQGVAIVWSVEVLAIFLPMACGPPGCVTETIAPGASHKISSGYAVKLAGVRLAEAMRAAWAIDALAHQVDVAKPPIGSSAVKGLAGALGFCSPQSERPP